MGEMDASLRTELGARYAGAGPFYFAKIALVCAAMAWRICDFSLLSARSGLYGQCPSPEEAPGGQVLYAACSESQVSGSSDRKLVYIREGAGVCEC